MAIKALTKKKIAKKKPSTPETASKSTKKAPTSGADQGTTNPELEYEGYCVKCKTKRPVSGHASQSANGTWMAKGMCGTCGTTVSRILGKNWKPA